MGREISKGAIRPVSAKVVDQDRHGLYVFVRRNLRDPFFEAFAIPGTIASRPKRGTIGMPTKPISKEGQPVRVAPCDRSIASLESESVGGNCGAFVEIRALRVAGPSAERRPGTRSRAETPRVAVLTNHFPRE